jgi:hypothetical protein
MITIATIKVLFGRVVNTRKVRVQGEQESTTSSGELKIIKKHPQPITKQGIPIDLN